MAQAPAEGSGGVICDPLRPFLASASDDGGTRSSTSPFTLAGGPRPGATIVGRRGRCARGGSYDPPRGSRLRPAARPPTLPALIVRGVLDDLATIRELAAEPEAVREIAGGVAARLEWALEELERA